MPAAYLKGSVEQGILSYRNANPGCTGKIRFESAAIAVRAAKRKRHRKAYRCEQCGYFHVGADTPEPTRSVKKWLIVRESELLK